MATGRIASREIVRTATEIPNIETDVFEQHVRVEASAIGTLYAAYRPLLVSLPATAYRFDSDGAIKLRRPLGRGSEYTVQSYRPYVTAAILREHDPADAASPPDGTMRGPVPLRVAELARRITANAPTSYDAVLAIEDWIGAHTTYTLDIPPLPKGADAVEQHLFVDRKGFCVQIATSTAVMLHSLGVPVRLGSGFTPGEESVFGGDFTVRAKDAHAWVEVWFPDVGWQAFDPTAHVPLSGEYDGSLLARIWRALQRLALVVALARRGARVLRRARGRPSPASPARRGVGAPPLPACRARGPGARSPAASERDAAAVPPRAQRRRAPAAGEPRRGGRADDRCGVRLA